MASEKNDGWWCNKWRWPASNIITKQHQPVALTKQQECFERWMADHIAILHRVVNGFATGADRRDLMQEVMLAIWKAIPSFRALAQPSTFIYRVSHNAAMTWQRSERNYRKRAEAAPRSGEIEESPSDTTPQEDVLEHLYAAIRQLPSLDRSLILLSLDGVSYQDMAEIHGLSAGNVGVRLNRIKQRLLATLKEQVHAI